jgi:branched-chain amino acid transport system permease protein
MAIVLFDGVAYGMLLFLIGVGLSITMGLMNFVNLAHGAFAMVGGYAASLAMQHAGLGFFAALAVAFVAAAAIGAVLEFAFFRHLYRSHPLDQVLLSIGVVFVAISVATYFFGPSMRAFTLPPSLEGRVNLLGLEVGRYRLFLVASGLAVLAALLLVLNIVVCVGGAGTISGPFLAALLVGIVDVAGKYYLPGAGAFLVYAVMVAMLLVRPNGIVPRKGLA